MNSQQLTVQRVIDTLSAQQKRENSPYANFYLNGDGSGTFEVRINNQAKNLHCRDIDEMVAQLIELEPPAEEWLTEGVVKRIRVGDLCPICLNREDGCGDWHCGCGTRRDTRDQCASCGTWNPYRFNEGDLEPVESGSEQ